MLKFKNGNIEISNVTAVEQFGEVQYYTTLVSIEELYKIRERITYDGEAQRGEINGKPLIDQKHVNQIYESFINGDSIRGHLIWNLRKENKNSKFEFQSNTGTIIIDANQLITIPDSAHRHAALQMVAENIDDELMLKSKFSLDIYTINKTEEKELFYTINGKIKAPNKNRTLYLSNSIECKLLREVISKSNLKNKVECIRNNSLKDGKLTKFSTLYDSLFNPSTGSFSIKDITDDAYDKYLKWFMDFYNELLETRDDFKIKTSDEKIASKQNSMVLEEITWWGYGLLAKELMGDRKWRHNLHNKMNKKVSVEGGQSIHFLDKANPLWHATVIKPKYNFIKNIQEIGTSVSSSNVTRNSLKKIFTITLF